MAHKLILFAMIFLFYNKGYADAACSLAEESSAYSANLGCSKGKSQSCIYAAAIGAGAVSSKLRALNPNSAASRLNKLYIEAKNNLKLYANKQK